MRVRGTGEFIQSDGSLKRFLIVEAITLVEPNGRGVDGDEPASLLAMVAEISARVPGAEWQTVPTDLARNLDHYLYGRNGKRNERHLCRCGVLACLSG